MRKWLFFAGQGNDLAQDRYTQILIGIFERIYEPNGETLAFPRTMIQDVAQELGIALPKNVGDVIYTFRNRRPIPLEIQSTAKHQRSWAIRSIGSGQYAFVQVRDVDLRPAKLAPTHILDATPELVRIYSQSDEQSQLALIRYNRLVDLFLNITAYHLQSHYRTQIPGIGQVEVDDLYVGYDKDGLLYIIPVQAKGIKGDLSLIQSENDMELCRNRFPNLVCRSVGVKQISNDTFALIEIGSGNEGLEKKAEKHFIINLTVRDSLKPLE